MIVRDPVRLPEEQEKAMRHARRLQWVWMLALASIVVAIYLTLGNSQAMKTAWIEDLLSFVPPIAFLVASRVERWRPNARFPLGYIRVTSIAYLVSAVALAGVGLFLVFDAGMALIHTEHPTIGSVELFGATVWQGWLMIAALAYSVILPVIFGRLKMRPARQLHDKVLWADALMNKADWMTGLAAAVGIVGIGFGWWWADAVAALFIAVDVLHDGGRHTAIAVRDLMDEVPRTVDGKGFDPLPSRMKGLVEELSWVRGCEVRLREEGRFVTGTVYVEPRGPHVDPVWVRDAEARMRGLHWRVDRISVVPVPDLANVLDRSGG
ncbi:cation diffusion facilitator family transporter [Arenibaculum sp.]|jgi:cation diffusion facilitator family transporter|uniref:cation diffusion facilitator family transporter n=1 Tax=Arenibaculum sp. TaxID=2865862 RepID=UPI002E15062B|nr:cation diffusion facilitator family transporter [Arenibaculum sp.]